MDNITPKKLHAELIAAGIEISGCDSEGIVLDTFGNEIQFRADVAEIIALHNPIETRTEQVFLLPLRAPSITVDDIFVESREIKSDPDAAFAEALSEAEKGKGNAKSLDLITRSALKKIDQLNELVKDLRKRVKQLEK